MAPKAYSLIISFLAISLVQSVDGETAVRVDPSIVAQLGTNTEVEVIVLLKDTSLIDYDRRLSKGKNYEIYWQKARYFETDQNRVLSKLLSSEFKIRYKYHIINGFSGRITRQGLEKLTQNPIVSSVMPNRKVRAGLEESLPLINATDVWTLCDITGEGQTVAILDTGIDYTHPDLAEKYLGGHDFVNNDDDPMDDNGHGTHVAGIAAANGTIIGVAPGANLVAVKVLNAAGGFGNIDIVIAGINWCVDNKDIFNISVINMSLGTFQLYPGHCDLDQAELSEAINAATAVGIFVAAASMNDGSTERIAAPACIQNATSVGATYDADVGDNVVWWPPPDWLVCIDESTEPDQIICFTNRCAILDLLAPGAIITSTRLGGGETNMSGTSMATPHVAGVAALLLEANSNLWPDEIENTLKETGVSINDPETGLSFTRVDAYKAVVFASDAPKFYVNNALNEIVAWFDTYGNLVLKGTLTQNMVGLEENPEHDEFRVKNSTGADVAIIDTTNGNMDIKGWLYEEQATLTPPTNSFIIKNSSNEVVCYIDTSGNLYLKGKLYSPEQ